ncbi:hypothetical protein, partial [Agrococcus jejuensis]|uniref:hypothetical protein n=1 Tax=Agrococcus jejuensis TaxID=399736 RepID=UPI001C92BBD0
EARGEEEVEGGGEGEVVVGTEGPWVEVVRGVMKGKVGWCLALGVWRVREWGVNAMVGVRGSGLMSAWCFDGVMRGTG